MASSRDGDNLDWLYRKEDEDPQRPRAERPVPGSDPAQSAAAGPGRRRATFSEDELDERPGARRPGSERPATPQRRPEPSPRRDAQAGQYRSPTAPPPPGPRGSRPAGPGNRPPRRRRGGLRPLGVIALLVVLWLVFLVLTPAYAWGVTTKINADPGGDRPADQPGTTYLLVGSDSREGLSEKEKTELGTGSTGGQRTDSIMLLYIPPSGRPALISIPRDSYVPIPGHGRNKINSAYAIGGAPLLVDTVEQSTGLRVDHFVEIGFGGFADVVDSLGGVEMCPKTAIKDRNAHLDIPAGCQNMDGATALGYVRMRYSDPTGDIGRMNRQREMIAAIVKKAASPATVLNPFRWWGLNTGAARSLRVDDGTSVTDMAGLVSPMRTISRGEGLALMVPISSADTATASGSSIIWNRSRALEMFGEIEAGDTSRLDRFAQP